MSSMAVLGARAKAGIERGRRERHMAEWETEMNSTAVLGLAKAIVAAGMSWGRHERQMAEWQTGMKSTAVVWSTSRPKASDAAQMSWGRRVRGWPRRRERSTIRHRQSACLTRAWQSAWRPS
jgi:hypothetical protein